MAQYIYEGSASRLVMGGRTFVRGIPVELTDPAAAVADAHPEVRRLASSARPASPPTNVRRTSAQPGSDGSEG